MLECYTTVKKQGKNEINIQKSRFIGYVKRCETEEEAQEFIQSIKKKHHDAAHNCSAYMIGEHDLIQKANDDGEPSGTAGVPMLEVLKKMKIKDTAVVVTRYFGGIKLGGGGLIRAYSSATSEAIRATGVVKRELMQEVIVHVEYTLLGKLENELRNSKYHIKKVHYLENVEIEVYVKNNEVEEFEGWITNLTSGQATIKHGSQEYMESQIEI
ncbi:YigZ family protein [Halobacillus andaensis]|uniref:YigZ family protein n=1 Tax=Halobacillus andaensis TaxID=1176239 RepID=A0A917B8I8_HALAA|nr:YigZ family protein [Halobacillus andaensis]MBP2005402.1 putative YigZ family protein [Halobacillus andaensis]GGF31193.1 YigZ family protein [Halobacillus andaensis]